MHRSFSFFTPLLITYLQYHNVLLFPNIFITLQLMLNWDVILFLIKSIFVKVNFSLFLSNKYILIIIWSFGGLKTEICILLKYNIKIFFKEKIQKCEAILKNIKILFMLIVLLLYMEYSIVFLFWKKTNWNNQFISLG